MVTLAWPEQETSPAAGTLPEAAALHIVISGLTKRYPGQQSDALHNVGLQIERGAIFGIIGRSGAGKSSLIRCLNRLEEPTSGSVWVDNVDLSTLSPHKLVSWRRTTGMIFQHFNLLSAKTVRENIELPMRVAGIPAPQRQRKVDELLALVGLLEHQHAWPAQLSGGQKQRVGIARALVHDPQLLLCDEATSALDPETTRAILDLLRDINRQKGITIVLITHEMNVIHDLCHQVAVLEQGRVIESGPVWQVYGDPQQVTSRVLLRPDPDGLPARLTDRLRAHPLSAQSRPLLALSYTGRTEVPPLTTLIRQLGDEVQLLQSTLEWVQGRQIGQLLLLAAASRLPFRVEKMPAGLADRVEVRGYVTD